MHCIQFHVMLLLFLLSIQLIFSLPSFVCFLSFPIYMQVFCGFEPIATGEQAWIFTTTPALESTFLYLFYAFMSFTFHVVLWHLYAEFPLDIVFMLCIDNGGVHNLLVGSEPTHCSCYLHLRLSMLWNRYLYIYKPIVSYLWWGDIYDLCLFIAIYCFMILPGFVPVLSQLGLASSGLCPRGL